MIINYDVLYKLLLLVKILSVKGRHPFLSDSWLYYLADTVSSEYPTLLCLYLLTKHAFDLDFVQEDVLSR